MKRRSQTLLLLASALLIGCGLLVSHWLAMPWAGIAGLIVLGVSLLLAAKSRPTVMPRRALSVAWISSLAVPASLWLERHTSHALDLSYALLAWLIAAAILTATARLDGSAIKMRWRMLGIIWALTGSVIWLAASYLQNNRLAFHLAVMVAVALLLLCKLWFRLPFSIALGVNSLLLLLVGIPVADLFDRPSYHLDTQPETAKKFYSYEFARKDPAAFAAWWNYYVNQVNQIQWRYTGDRFTQTNHLGYPVHLTPNCQGLLFQSVISINSMGFRGPEFPDEKSDAYRIVALGESTTFGMTLRADDKPWPEVLEKMIRDRLKPDRPVHVINAGLPAWDLQQNLGRLPAEILPLKPDMIISYHGYNGFYLLDRAMPRTYGHKQPAFRERPLKLLADAEYGLKMMQFRRSLVPKLSSQLLGGSDPLDSDYADAYRQLIQIAETNHIRLVILNFSMAVNDRSDPDVTTFYRAGFPSVHRQIQANILHSRIVKQLAEQHTNVCLIDSHPGLDGEHEKFIDLVHFAQEGREQLAETIFAGIKSALESILAER